MNVAIGLDGMAPQAAQAGVLDNVLSAASFLLPDWIGTSAWLQHGPFAFPIIHLDHPAMMTRYGWGAVRAQA